jgi:hypothetical protein
MTSRLYALASGGAVLVTALATLVTPGERRTQNVPATVPQAVDRSGAVVDLGVQADRLKAKLAEVPRYQEPARNAFHFGEDRPRALPGPDIVPPSVNALPPAATTPSKPPYALAGMAATSEDGVVVRTAIVSSLRGVSLVKEGDLLDGAYRVVSVADETIILESTADGTQTTIGLSHADEPR